jgi:hypothetical protein
VLFEAVQRQVAERRRSRVLERALAQDVAVLAGQADVRCRSWRDAGAARAVAPRTGDLYPLTFGVSV